MKSHNSRPNIIFVLTDQLKPEALSAYGNATVKTPNIERMAKEGVVFERFYANSALCGPCRYAIYTGTYPFGEPEWAQPNCASIRGVHYMGDFLQQAGYQTVSFGRLHGMPENATFGFSECKHSWEEADLKFNDYRNWVLKKLNDHPDKDTFLDKWHNHQEIYPPMVLDDQTFFPRELSEEVWLTEQTQNFLDGRSDDQPFFLHLGLLHPHLPWLTLRDEDEKYDLSEITCPENTGSNQKNLSQRPMLKAIREKWFENYAQRKQVMDFTEQDWKNYIANYYGAVGQVDKMIGRLLDMLQARNMQDNTIVILSSDHSEQLGAFGLDQKWTLYDGSVHLPLIFWGQSIPAGQRRRALCEQIDLLPTFLDFADFPADLVLEGTSLKPIIQSSNCRGKEAVYAWLSCNGATHASIRTDRYKLYRAGERADCSAEVFELFDLQKDPLETKNLYNKIDNDEIRKLKSDFYDFFWNHAGEIGCSRAMCRELGFKSPVQA